MRIAIACALLCFSAMAEDAVKPVKPPAPPPDVEVAVDDKPVRKRAEPVPASKKVKRPAAADVKAEQDARGVELMTACVKNPMWEFLNDIQRLRIRRLAGAIASGEVKPMPLADYLNLDAKSQNDIKIFFPFLIEK